MNGRELLRRSLETAGIAHTVKGNKFLSNADYDRAQEFLDLQRNVHRKEVLDSLVPEVFPSLHSIVGDKATARLRREKTRR